MKIVSPSKIVCVGKNYLDHAKEMGGEVPEQPLLFLKPPSALIGPNDPIVIPEISTHVEHEAEIAIVIARRLRHVSEDEAVAGIQGFTCLNDVTARDWQKRESQWARAKGFDTFCPVGPAIVNRADWKTLEIIGRVNGVVRQHGKATEMVFGIPFLLSHISQVMTLEPGDVVATGTPAGVGRLAPGDVVEVEIPGVGVLRNPVVASGERLMIRLSERVTRLPGYPLADVPLVKRRLLEAGVDVIDLGAGDNDAPPPAAVIERMQRAVAAPAFSKYGFQQGSAKYRQAASDYLARRFGQTFDPATELVPLIGSKEGLAHLPFAVVDPGDTVIVPEPGYQGYIGGTLLSGAQPFIYPLRAENGFLLDLDRVPANVLAKTRLVYLNYPNNPTAAVADLGYLEQTVAICRRHGIVLAYDNAYCDLTFDGYRAPSIFELPGAREVAIEFFSLSKSFSMTGWRIGFAAGNRELIGALTKIKTYVDTGPFLAVQDAGVAALERAEEYSQAICRDLVARRDAGVAALEAIGLGIDRPLAAMYLWIPLPPDLPSARFARHVLESEGVVTLPGSGFGPAGEGYFRIALTVSPARITEAVVRIGRALATFDRRAVAASA